MGLRVTRRLIISTLIVTLFAMVAAAQDAGQVLRVSVGFGTLKNTPEVIARLTPEKRAEVDRLAELARQSNAAGKYGEALKHYYHAIAILRGTEWTPARALSSALTLKIDKAMLEPGQPVAVKVGQIFPLDEKLEGKLAGSITLVKMTGDERVKELKSLEGVEPDFITRPYATEILVPEVEPGNYRISLKLQMAAGEPVVKNATVHIERGLAAQAEAAKARASKLESILKSKNQDALLAALPSALYRISLFDLANAGEINFDRIDFNAQLKEANSMLNDLDAGKDPFARRRADFKKAYLSKVDNTLQPYRVYVPTTYDGSKAYPLVIALHGMGGDENSYFEAYNRGAFKVEAEDRGYIVACPKGRKPASMYIGEAERDVMDVIEEMKRAYRIDPDRIYLTGHSMGGFGTWSIAMNHPDVFAALAPVAGGVTNPANMSKIAHIPQIVIHGDKDPTVPVDRSRVMVAMGKKLGVELKFIEVPGGDHGSVVAPTFKDVFEWFDTHRRKAPEAKAASNSKSS
ncbi:MAG TPA: prolyl oligopeptidase family serine peptidase [Blastocatellia bacterium]|jgi:predicted esterase